MIWIYAIFFVLAIAKWAEVGFIADISWWWILTPLFLTIVWFEVLERAFGMDKQREVRDSEAEKAKRERIRRQLGRDARKRR